MILIPDVRMPENCYDCGTLGVSDLVGLNCPCLEDKSKFNHAKRAEGCPLILTLLKKQEAVEPQLSISGMWYECPVCHRHLLKDRDNYCARCGKAVKWE